MDLAPIIQLLQQKIGFDPKVLNPWMLTKAVEQRQAVCQTPDLNRYYQILQTSTTELSELTEQIVIPETWFFRDRKPFDFLIKYVRSEWPNAARKGKLKVLSVPCSTGEEPYSIAIALIEAGLSPTQFTITAIDISHAALSKAKQAIYGKNSFRGQDWINLDRYFSQGEKRILTPTVQNTVKFQQGNLLTALADKASQYDIIFCRNLLIYLDQSVIRQIFETFHQRLTPQGILLVGAAETAKVPKTQFRPTGESFTFAYRKIILPTPVPLIPQPIPIPPAQPVQHSTRITRPIEHPIIQKVKNTSPIVTLQNIQDLANAGNLNVAIQNCQIYLEKNSTHAEAHNLLGTLYNATGNSAEAETCFQKAIYLQPDHYEALMQLALLKEARGDTLAVDRLQKRIQKLQV